MNSCLMGIPSIAHLMGPLFDFDLDTRVLSPLLLDDGRFSETVVRKREYRILAAWPLEMGWRRTGSAATKFQSIYRNLMSEGKPQSGRIKRQNLRL